ncbi:MAG: endonuclease/exonuclease/phosphatase family protein [Solirubrobacterales bacterium]|nr:endonuclease/exonuclease/phosphatase family protein [Solirubrobacterales bacterium]
MESNSSDGALRGRRRIRTGITLAVCAPWVGFLVIRLFGLESGTVLLALVAATPVFAATAALPLIVAAALRVWPAAGLAAVVAFVLVALVLPRAFGEPTEPAGSPGPTLQVLAANMRLGQASAQPLVDLVNDLDVDVLSVEELSPELAQELKQLGLERVLAHHRLQPALGSGGSGIYSRLPISSSELERLPGGFPLISVDVQPPGGVPVQIFSVHTNPPTTAGEWGQDLAAVPPASPTRILLGDFNATLDHADFRGVLDSGYDDAAETLGGALAPTWPVGRRILPALFEIDHVLAGSDVGIRAFSTHDLPDSDHHAVFAELQLPAG